MEKLLLFGLLLFAFILKMNRGQAASDLAFYFGVYSVHPVPGFSPMKGTCNCKNSKRILLTVTVAGSDGDERVLVHRLENNSGMCPASPLSQETAIHMDQTPLPTAPTIPDVREELNDTSRKVEGGGGGEEPGGGGDGPGEGGPDDDGNTNRNSGGDGNENGENREILSKFQRKTLKKLAKISISIAAQTGIALLALPRDNKPTFIVYLVVIICVCAYFFCFFSIISEKKLAAAITAAIGTLFAAVGFLLTMYVIVLPFSIWAFVLCSLILVISIFFFFFVN